MASPLSSYAIRAVSTVLQSWSGAQLTVLIFHRVLPQPDWLFPDVPDATRFARQLAVLRDCFRVMPLAEAIDGLACGRLPRRAAAITFDDGYADNATVALPLLRRFGMSATFFVATGFLDGGRMWNDTVIESVRRCNADSLDLTSLGLGIHGLASQAARIQAIRAVIPRVKHLPPERRQQAVDRIAQLAGATLPDDLMMTCEQVRTLAREGMEVGAHTVTHPILASTEDARAEQEIRDSKAVLEGVLGGPVSLFAYPNGKPGEDYTEVHVAMVKRAGFRAALSTSPGVAARSADLYQIPRFTPWAPSPQRFGLQLARNFLRTRYAMAHEAGASA